MLLSKIKQGKIRGVGREMERVCYFIKGGEERPDKVNFNLCFFFSIYLAAPGLICHLWNLLSLLQHGQTLKLWHVGSSSLTRD